MLLLLLLLLLIYNFRKSE